ncbi:precorrin-3B C(17)-methyltransferase [Parabacteroides sp. AF18-52]|uniref:precorrin-3B C(17)-methyltransferase n=1 Tax=Parabacteroides TaxID=375288 RepID=UPI000EFFB1BD|nr:precorrin-3B C(17)-methyltransferase [Parabacteroides sp. AF18-52]RHR36135.1 precorrin-3B C(17)-methyltransferase [Parabacteroides sp. AF18-52]
MGTGKIIVAGIGPGSESDITPAVLSAIRQSDVIVGYKYYFRFIEKIIHPGAICIDSGMKREKTRAEEAYNYAAEGKVVTVISSGDAGIYGMAPLIYEMQREKGSNISIEVLPGISAFQKAASLLGAPVGHDFCVLSLSDLMTPWELIEKRIKAASMADFITAIYNPKSEGRYWQLYRLIELFLQERDPQTPVGFVRQAGREEQEVTITTLADFDPEQVDMFTVILIGNSQTYRFDNKMITPRGYYGEIKMGKAETGIGQDIMIRSFRTIEKDLKNKDIPLDKKWALLHAIHTTADFDMENILRIDDNAVASLYDRLNSGAVRTIITDVTMAASGIRKGALQRMGLEVKCYLQDEKTVALATEKGITRTQAGIRIAVGEHPDALFVFGNAPTALMELCDLIRKGKATPAGIIAAPVGFVHVQESKHMVKPFTSIPKLIVEGRKGGSNLAATLVNSILCYNDAINLKPGRDV